MVIVGPNVAAAASAQPKTVVQCKKHFKHSAKARTACIKRVRKAAKPISGGSCSLEAYSTNNGGRYGDTKDLGVSLKVLGNPGLHGAAQYVIEVAIHNPKVTICSVAMVGVVPDEGAPLGPAGETPFKDATFPGSISPHGGASRPISVPANFDVPKATVYARMG